jgi:hypothetical protein
MSPLCGVMTDFGTACLTRRFDLVKGDSFPRFRAESVATGTCWRLQGAGFALSMMRSFISKSGNSTQMT